MSEIKLTHGPDRCCECVFHLESCIRAADALAKVIRTEAERDNFMHPNVRTALANYEKVRNGK